MRFAWIIFLSLILTGCVTSPVYNPMQTASPAFGGTSPAFGGTSPQEISLNESGLKAVRDGMTMDQVHKIMGQELVIGYAFQSPDYKPLTIPNPYKSEAVKGTGCFIEYYIEAIRQPDGVVRDNELMPLIFKNGRLIGRGWPLVRSLRPKGVLGMRVRPVKPSA